MSVYEQDDLLSQYLMLHYGAPEEVLPYPDGPRAALDYPVRCVTELLDVARLPAGATALDIGCAVGRSSFELARHCDAVLGIDLSRRFIDTARTLAAEGSMDYYRVEEGELQTPMQFRRPGAAPLTRVLFEVGDACALRPDLGSFDVVLNANLIDRLPEPEAFLGRLADLVQPGGQLLLSSPFTWLEGFTARDKWLGGFEHEGNPVTTWEQLSRVLSPHFALDHTCDLPFLIREHARKFQWSVARAGRWIRRS